MKKYKKIISVIIAFILTLIPFLSNEAYAYTGGWLQGKTMNYRNASGTSIGSKTEITDLDQSTYVTLQPNESLYYYFGTKPFPQKYSLLADGTGLSIIFDKLDGYTATVPNPKYDGAVTPVGISSSGITAVRVKNTATTPIKVYEFDIYDTIDTTAPGNISNLTASNITDSGFKVSFVAPSDTDLDKFRFYLNGNLVNTIPGTIPNTQLFYTFTGLTADFIYSLKITSIDKSGNESSGTNLTVKTNYLPDTTPPSNITNLTATPTFKSVSLSWTNPPETDFAKVKIYEDGVYKKSVTASEGSTAFFDNLDPETLYTFKVTSVDNTGNESVGSTIQVTTLPLPEVKNIKNLDANAKYDRVTLSWKLPESEYFHHVNIYRKVVQEESFLQSLFSMGSTTVYAADTSDGYKPMFETNGTYWTDLTVDPDTIYNYKLSSENTDGRESEGITTQVTTPEEPKPKIEGAKFTTSANGDYVVSWTEPKAGSIKLFVGGEEYKTVPASQGSYTIPKAGLKYTTVGDPDIKIQPITDRGTEGDSIANPKTSLPFSVTDLVESGNGLLWLIGPFLLLALAFLLVPKFRKLLVGKGKGAADPKENLEEELKGRRLFQGDEKKERSKNEKAERIKKEPKAPREPRIPRIYVERTERDVRLPRESRILTRQPREPRKRRGI